MPKETQHKIDMHIAAGNARLLQAHWDIMPDDQRKEMAMQACAALAELMAVRNAILSLADLECPAEEIVRDDR